MEMADRSAVERPGRNENLQGKEGMKAPFANLLPSRDKNSERCSSHLSLRLIPEIVVALNGCCAVLPVESSPEKHQEISYGPVSNSKQTLGSPAKERAYFPTGTK
jgi:hypothetical protein